MILQWWVKEEQAKEVEGGGEAGKRIPLVVSFSTLIIKSFESILFILA